MDIDTKKRLLSSFAAAEEFIQGKAGKMGDVMKKKTGIFYMTVCVFGISLAVCGIQAVSYTHLDVYKRQAQQRVYVISEWHPVS